MALELAAPGVGIGHAASSWIRWAEKCISGRRCTVKLTFPECIHNHLRRRIAFKFLPWLAFVFSFPVSKMCQSGKAMLDINSLELSSPSTAVCSAKCKQQAWLKQLCLSEILAGRLQHTCPVHAHAVLGEGLSWLMWVLCDCMERVTPPLRWSHMFWATKWLSLFMHPRFFELHLLRVRTVWLAEIYGHRAAGSERWMSQARPVDSLILSNDSSLNIYMITVCENGSKFSETIKVTLRKHSQTVLEKGHFPLKLYNLLLPLIWNTLILWK